jgi:hypothetical protein
MPWRKAAPPPRELIYRYSGGAGADRNGELCLLKTLTTGVARAVCVLPGSVLSCPRNSTASISLYLGDAPRTAGWCAVHLQRGAFLCFEFWWCGGIALSSRALIPAALIPGYWVKDKARTASGIVCLVSGSSYSMMFNRLILINSVLSNMVLPPFLNIRCFSFMKQMYLYIF